MRRTSAVISRGELQALMPPFALLRYMKPCCGRKSTADKEREPPLHPCSNPATLLFVKATLDVINQMQTDAVIGNYAIGGAVGATFYLEPVATLDIDVFVSLQGGGDSPLLSLTPIYDYLLARGHKAEKEYIVIAGWPVQFLPPGNALVKEALTQAVETEVESVRTRVMTAEHLTAIALQTGRAKDFARILQFIESGTLDVDKLDDILRRHGLVAKWEQFGDKFQSNE
jgi:hypothetical protein